MMLMSWSGLFVSKTSHSKSTRSSHRLETSKMQIFRRISVQMRSSSIIERYGAKNIPIGQRGTSAVELKLNLVVSKSWRSLISSWEEYQVPRSSLMNWSIFLGATPKIKCLQDLIYPSEPTIAWQSCHNMSLTAWRTSAPTWLALSWVELLSLKRCSRSLSLTSFSSALSKSVIKTNLRTLDWSKWLGKIKMSSLLILWVGLNYFSQNIKTTHCFRV